MFETQGTTPNPTNPLQLTGGMPVYDANNAKVGTISAVDPQAGYFTTQRGVIVQRDLYLPVSAIARNDANGVYLTLTKDELKDERYTTAPIAGSMPGSRAAEATPTAPSPTQADETLAQRRDDVVGDIRPTSQPETSPRTVSRQAADEIRVPLREETLIPNKVREQIGDVHVHRYVVQEERTIEAPITHEEVSIEHVITTDRPVGADAFSDDELSEKDIDVPVMGERLNIAKETHLVEEVRIHKEIVTEQQQASGTVRKEQLKVEGDAQDLLRRDDSLRERDLPDRDLTH